MYITTLSCFLTYFYFFSIIILLTQTHKIKNIPMTRCYCIFPVLGKKAKKNKLKQSKIKVKMIIKMKRQFMLKLANLVVLHVKQR